MCGGATGTAVADVSAAGPRNVRAASVLELVCEDEDMVAPAGSL
jgi:hypothetical protein